MKIDIDLFGDDRGFGDTVGRAINVVTRGKIKGGGGCKKRKALLNRMIPYRGNRKLLTNAGRIGGKEGGLRLDVFSHDNSAYQNGIDFSTEDCMVCELPENAQRYSRRRRVRRI